MTGTAPAGVAISLRGCAKTFADGTRALEPLDLDVAPGETLVLLGPSGCGKTTTLRLIAGLDYPDPGGRVSFAGEDVTAVPIERRNVGMVFQSYALFPNMNVADNVAYGLRVRGLGRPERLRQAGEVLDMMRIGNLADRRIDQLSGGQRQRVALARALAIRPRAILLDEPLTALDASLREHLRSEIEGLLRSLAITAVYVTHDQGEALALADRVVVMRTGAIAQIGTPREIYFRPKDAFVADFVGTTNRLEGTIQGGLFESAAGTIPIDGADRKAVTLAFRPETVAVAPGNAGPLRFRVARVQFLGARQRVWLADPNGATIMADTDARTALEPGTAVSVSIDLDSSVLL